VQIKTIIIYYVDKTNIAGFLYYIISQYLKFQILLG